jgi:hypothetical protein
MNLILNYSIDNPFILTLLACILGIFVALICKRTAGCTRNMTLSLMLLPPLVTVALLALNGSLGTSIAILGVFSLVRFRSIPGSAKDIVSVFYSMATGLLVATGKIGIAVLLVLFIGVMDLLICKLFKNPSEEYELKILVPENFNFEEIFDEIVAKYFDKYSLYRVKTTNMGAMFELTYRGVPKADISRKELLDDVRTHNGNLNVSFCICEKGFEVL